MYDAIMDDMFKNFVETLFSQPTACILSPTPVSQLVEDADDKLLKCVLNNNYLFISLIHITIKT